jgi:hypothetical protein
MANDDFKGLDLTHPINRAPANHATSAVNVRAYLRSGIQLRNLLTDPILTIGAIPITIARLNDTTPAGPSTGFTIITAADNGTIFNNSNPIASGLSGNPVSIIPFRPNASVQPWAYVADSFPQGAVTLDTSYLISGDPVAFISNGMLKVRSDGLVYKMGIKEPSGVPLVGIGSSIGVDSGPLYATTLPWTIAQATGFNFGQSNPSDGTAPYIIDVLNASTVTVNVNGSATVNGSLTTPIHTAPDSAAYPGQFVQAPGSGTVPGGTKVVLGAFVEADGVTIVPHAIAPFSDPNPVSIGMGAILNVPPTAATLQVGIDSAANTFSSNSGAFALTSVVQTNSVVSVLSTVGNVTAYVWGDSPHSGAVGVYIWKNPTDTGPGTPRSISNAAVNPINNSWIFDSTPEDGTVPVQWTTLDSAGNSVGSIVLFSPALEPEGYQDFNVCVIGTLFVPAIGTYTFTLRNKDQAMFGIGGISGSDVPGGFVTGPEGQTMSVVSGLPLVYVAPASAGAVTASVQITFPAVGTYPIELDWDYWYHSGRSLVLTASPTPGAATSNIPPISNGVRMNVSYAYKYRSSATGAQSNPSPATSPELTPVISNTVQSIWSPDPQVDKVDYYRQDSGLANYTYVATGPNDGLGGTIGGIVYNTSITDSLSDLAAANNQIMELDDFEPFPSIDLPAAGIVDISGGVVNWVSGTKFNTRWLPGTIMLIGTPTQLAYPLVTRPTSTTAIAIPGIPDGSNLVYNIAEPILAAQPLPYLFGPTDNINFTFAVGDPLRSGTLYWCKGSNLDSAPDTNQMDVTDPSEALVNGAMSGGRGVLFSIKRAWVIMPNFLNALATITGTSGSTWTLQDTSIDRGLFIPRCLDIEGGGKIFFRVDDGVHVSANGLASRSITDSTLYPLFSHEGSIPQPITRLGVTYYPPDDSMPQHQTFNIINGYLYYDYIGTDGNPYTLVYDIQAEAWVLDIYPGGSPGPE